MSKGKIIGIISIKGGVGKTTTVCSLGAALASDFNKKVLVVDANFSAPTLALYLGMVDLKKSIYNVLKDKEPVANAIVAHQENLDVLPASVRIRKVNPFGIKKVLNKLRGSYDIILVDSSPNLNDEMLATMVAADELLVVTTPDYPTLSATMHAVKTAKKQNANITGIILNKVRSLKFELNAGDIEDAAGVPVISILPDKTKVLEALAYSKPITSYNPENDVSVGYKKLAACLVGDEYKDTRRWQKIRNIFNPGISKDEINRAVIAEKRRKELGILQE